MTAIIRREEEEEEEGRVKATSAARAGGLLTAACPSAWGWGCVPAPGKGRLKTARTPQISRGSRPQHDAKHSPKMLRTPKPAPGSQHIPLA